MYAWYSDTIGPITRTVADNARFLSGIAGRDEHDPLSSTRTVPDYYGNLGGSLRGMRLAFVSEIARADGMHSDVRQAFEQTLDVLKQLGAQIGEVSLPLAKHAIPLQMLTSDADSASMYLDCLRTQWDRFDVGTRSRMAAAALVPAVIHSRAMRARALVRGEVLAALTKWDALICPTNSHPPALIDDAREKVASAADVANRLILRRLGTHTFGAANVPTLALPMGFSSGLPLSLQIAARPFAEDIIYRVGHAYEQATPWHKAHPDLERTLGAYLVNLSQDQVVAMARAVALDIPPHDLENVRLRLSALLTAMEAIEDELGAEMDQVDPAPPVILVDDC